MMLSPCEAVRAQKLLYQLRAREFDESKHERDEDGKFSEKGGDRGGTKQGLKFLNTDKPKKEKKLPQYLKVTAKPKQYDDFEKVWNEKYAAKWDSIIEKGGTAKEKALMAIEDNIKGYNEFFYRFREKDIGFFERTLDKLNELLGNDYTLYGDWKDRNALFLEGTRDPTREEAEAFAERANELNKRRNKRDGDNELDENRYKPEDFDTLKKLRKNESWYIRDEDEFFSEEELMFDDFKIQDKLGGPKYELGGLESDLKYGLMKNPMKFYDALKDEKGIGEMLERQAELDAVLKRSRDKTKSIWRGGELAELDGLLEKGFVGGGRSKGVEKRSMRGRIPASYAKGPTSMFNDGILFEYDKEEIGDRAHPEYYNLFVTKEFAYTTDVYGGDYTEHGHIARFRDQEEVLMRKVDKIKPKKLKIHVSTDGETTKELGLNKKENQKKFLEKYGHLGEIVFSTQKEVYTF